MGDPSSFRSQIKDNHRGCKVESIITILRKKVGLRRKTGTKVREGHAGRESTDYRGHISRV